MIKKILSISALVTTFALVACGGDKSEAQTQEVDNTPAKRDSLIELLNACYSTEELQEFKMQNKELIETLPKEMQYEIDSISMSKALYLHETDL